MRRQLSLKLLFWDNRTDMLRRIMLTGGTGLLTHAVSAELRKERLDKAAALI